MSIIYEISVYALHRKIKLKNNNYFKNNFELLTIMIMNSFFSTKGKVIRLLVTVQKINNLKNHEIYSKTNERSVVEVKPLVYTQQRFSDKEFP